MSAPKKGTAKPTSKRVRTKKTVTVKKLHQGSKVNMVSALASELTPEITLLEGHTLEIIEVCDRYTLGELETRNEVLVNIGTYFKQVGSVNFYVSPYSYSEFLRKFPTDSYYEFIRLHNDYQRLKKLDGSLPIPKELNVFALSKECKITERRVVMPLTTYRSNPCFVKRTGTHRFVFHTELDDWYGADMRKYYYGINLPILRFLQNGSEDIPLVCRITGAPAEDVEVHMHGKESKIRPCAYELHHINVLNGTSTEKGEYDPAKIMCSTDLNKSKDKLIDIMGTICLSKVAHSNIHMWPCSDINNYTADQLPWCLQNPDNFYTTCRKYGLKLQYAEFIWSQTNK